jgi:hypothetical protein
MPRQPTKANDAALENRRIGLMPDWILGWTWAIIAGGGGLWLLGTRGPWPLTDGWFALCSGISACPLTAWLLKKYAGVKLSAGVQLSLAVIFFAAGKIALRIGT